MSMYFVETAFSAAKSIQSVFQIDLSNVDYAIL